MIVTSDFSNELVKSFLPEEILKSKPVIAGGFALSLYLTCISSESNFIKQIRKNITKNEKALPFPFSDIDIWFLKDNPEIEVIKEIFLSENPKIISGTLEQEKYTTDITKKSFWANTYRFTIQSPKFKHIPIQFIKKNPDTIEQLITDFDIKICSVAWYDGKFYLSDDLHQNFESKTIEFNNFKRIKRQKFGSKVFQSLRYFKYAQRFNLEFSKEMFDFVVELTSSVSDYFDKTSKDNSDQKTFQLTSSNGSYTEEVVNSPSMQRMCRQLIDNFDLLSKMSHWTSATPLFLANSKHVNIKKYLTKNDNNSTSNSSFIELPF
jgi:hypothetical protein